jgi:hypothetical protein
MVLCIGIEQPADHALILRMMFPRLTLEKLDASLAQRNGDLDAFARKTNSSGRGRKSGTALRSPRGSEVYLILLLIDSRSFHAFFLTGS